MMLKILAWATLSAIRRDLWLLAAVFWFLRWVVGARRRRRRSPAACKGTALWQSHQNLIYTA